MADHATGPVKPPVIDLTARSSASSRGEAEARPDAEPGIGHRNDAPPTPAQRESAPNWPLLGGVAAGGAVLGTILTYLLAFALPLPSHQVDVSGDVAAQGTRLDGVASSVEDLQNSTTKTQVSLDATIARLDSALTEVKSEIATVKAAIPAAQARVDLAPLEDQMKTLQAQIDAIGAGASGSDAGAIGKSLAAVETSVANLTTRLNGVDSTVGTMRSDLDAARKALSDHVDAASANEVGPALKLPLILSGLEDAFATGKPFASELAGLASVMPSVAVPDAVKAAATAGLSRPDALLQQFEATLPAILAARSMTGSDWVGNVVDWGKSLLALRPAADTPGDAPDAVVSRLEGAMGRRDYAAAATLLEQLPLPMRDAAGPMAADIATHAAADAFVADLRSKALSAAETSK